MNRQPPTPAIALLFAGLVSLGTASPAAAGSVEEYLVLLRQIAPAAEEGARAYLQAHARRCGSTLTEAQLRSAVADGAGDRVLMQMIRAAQVRDRAALDTLGHQIRCRNGSAR